MTDQPFRLPKPVTCEIRSDCTGNRICVNFPWHKDDKYLNAMRTVPGRSFVSTKKPKHWHVPLDMETCRELRRAFGQDLEIGPTLRSWAEGAVKHESKMGSIAMGQTAELVRLPHVLPSLYEAVHLGPLGRFMTDEQKAIAMTGPGSYQAADVAFLAASAAPLNGNDQGTGKTIEWIAAVWEAGLESGSHLVICPKSAVDGTWEDELVNWQAGSPSKKVEVFVCVDNREDREDTLRRFEESTAEVKWVVINPAMVSWVKDDTRTSAMTIALKGRKAEGGCTCKKSKSVHEHYRHPYPVIAATTWTTIAVDEAHKASVRNHRTVTSKAIGKLKYSHKRCVMTGTPMKKKGGSDIWGLLNFLNPEVFSSYWTFVGGYFEIEKGDYGAKVHELLPERTDAFFRMLQPYMLRRTKAEVAPWLPDKLYVPIWCTMGDAQRKQYESMEKSGVAQIDGREVTTTGVLDQLTRLKQCANARVKMSDKLKLTPLESCKVDAMLEVMEQGGMFDDGATKKQIVFSQSREMVNFVADKLKARGLKTEIISGAVNKKGERKRIKDDFQNGDTRVLVIVTTAGGVSLTLDMADDVHLIDEMWDPGEDQQAEDRAHRVSRNHQVTIYIYRTRDTIDQYIMDTKMAKAVTHSFIMDVRRQIVAKWKVPA